MLESTTIAVPENLLKNIGLKWRENIHYQLCPEELTAQTVERGEGVLNNNGVLVIKTGEFTGRSPIDTFSV